MYKLIKRFLSRGNATPNLIEIIDKSVDEDSIIETIQDCIVGAELEITDSAEWTPLIFAVNRGYENVVRQLVTAGANVDTKDAFEWTPLIHAVQENRSDDIVRQLLKAGADVNIPNEDGKTPLMYAAECGRKDVVKILLKAGADKSVKDCLGKIALDYVINNEWILVDSPLKDNRKEIAKILQNC